MGAANSKSSEAFRTIGEVAAELDVPQHVLRFWESKFAHIRPVKRGGGRRYYRPDDVDLLRSIKHLLHDNGYTIKGVQKLLRENGPGALRHAVSVKLVGQDESSFDESSFGESAAAEMSPMAAPSAGSPAPDQALIADVIRDLEALRRKLLAD